MKLFPKGLIWAFVVVFASALGATATPGSPADALPLRPAVSPLLGTWSVDISRLPMPPGQRPRSVRFTFDDAGSDKWTVRVDIVYAPGKEAHSVSTVPLDGTSATVENSPEADRVALKRPAPNVLVMALQKGSTLVSTRIYSVMPDGSSMVETEVYPGPKGLAVMKTHYFTRIR